MEQNRTASTKRKATVLPEQPATTPEPSRENGKGVKLENRENVKEVDRESCENGNEADDRESRENGNDVDRESRENETGEVERQRRENENEVERGSSDKDKVVEEQMERFYALLENIKAMRYAWGGGASSKKINDERKEAVVPWKPTFRMEDFMQGDDKTFTAKRVKKDDGEVTESNGS